jgi:class 3 adenylate cyclase
MAAGALSNRRQAGAYLTGVATAPPPGAFLPGRLRPWQRLSVRHAAFFATLTLVAVGAVAGLTYHRHQREVEDSVGTQLLNIARVSALLVDPALHAEVQQTRAEDSDAYRRLQAVLARVQSEAVLSEPIYTLSDLVPERRVARRFVVSRGAARPGEPYPLVPEMSEPLQWTFGDGFARYTGIYRLRGGTWLSAFAPILGPEGRPIAVLVVDYPLVLYLDRLHELQRTLVFATGVSGLGALLLGFLFARHLTRPIAALTAGVTRVARGDLSQALAVRSRDEVGHLTAAFNSMVEGLRQRDFIRSAFGRYVSPEVAQALLDSPGGLRFGGATREVTVLMSDLRGYTRFAEQGDPEHVMEVLNGYLARMTEIVIQHGGTINEFIGDAIFAVFGAPLAQPDHAERAAACALAMQAAMAEINAGHAARGLPPFEMGIGVHTGEAVAGNIGSEQRAKYAIVGSAVNVAGRTESATVGGQVLVTAATYERIRALAEVGAPVPLEVKGLAEPLVLYELLEVRGRFAQRRATPERGDGTGTDVDLPLECWVLEGKVIRPDPIAGRVVRLGASHVATRMATPLPPLTNVRLRLLAATGAPLSGDLYGKVVGGDAGPSGLTRIHLTGIGPQDRRLLERLGGPADRAAASREGRGDLRTPEGA